MHEESDQYRYSSETRVEDFGDPPPPHVNTEMALSYFFCNYLDISRDGRIALFIAFPPCICRVYTLSLLVLL